MVKVRRDVHSFCWVRRKVVSHVNLIGLGLNIKTIKCRCKGHQLDGFDARGNIKVLMATNRPDTLDPALLRPGRLDRKVEFGLPDLEGRTHILKIHSRRMSCDRDIRFELIARLCPNTTGADLKSVCTEAGMFAIRARRKSVSEKDFLDSVNKVVKGYKKFSSTPEYMAYN